MESLIHCSSQALQQTSGVQRRQYERWRKTLLSCLAHVEAVIDFGDDNDIESGVAQEVLPVVEALRLELDGHLQDGQSTALHYIASSHRSMGCVNSETACLLHSSQNLEGGNEISGVMSKFCAFIGWRGELLRDGLKVALVGPPNAGKSTILNKLAGRSDAWSSNPVIAKSLHIFPQSILTASLRSTLGHERFQHPSYSVPLE